MLHVLYQQQAFMIVVTDFGGDEAFVPILGEIGANRRCDTHGMYLQKV